MLIKMEFMVILTNTGVGEQRELNIVIRWTNMIAYQQI